MLTICFLYLCNVILYYKNLRGTIDIPHFDKLAIGYSIYNLFISSNIIMTDGLYNSLCVPNKQHDRFIQLFVISRAVCFFETIIIIMKGSHLSFFHVVHHVAAFMYAKTAYDDKSAMNIILIAINSFAHIIIYSRIDKRLVKLIKILQCIIVMVLCTIVRGLHYLNINCDNDTNGITMLLYASLLTYYLYKLIR